MALETPADGRIVLTGEFTLQSAEAVHSELLQMTDQPNVQFDCGAITEVDLSLIQLIVAARRSAERSGRKVTLAQPASGALRAALLHGGFIGADTEEPKPDQAFWLQVAGVE